MIPLSDSALRRTGLPLVNLTLIALNLAIFFYELSLGPRQLERLVMSLGAIPYEITTGRDLPPSGPSPLWLTLLTSMFLHGGWLHIGSNMLYLWVFGDNVEDALGSLRYLLFYLTTGLAAGAAQIMAAPYSQVPSIGASGAISGVLGAYLILFPRASVTTLILLGYFIRLVPLPAILVIGFWAITQFFSGLASLGVPVEQTSGVAYWAHIGGFLAGLTLVRLFTLGRPKRAYRRSW